MVTEPPIYSSIIERLSIFQEELDRKGNQAGWVYLLEEAKRALTHPTPDRDSLIAAISSHELRSWHAVDGMDSGDRLLSEADVIAIVRQYFGEAAFLNTVDNSGMVGGLDAGYDDPRTIKSIDCNDLSMPVGVNPRTSPEPVSPSEISVVDIARELARADLDEPGSEDWKHYRHMATMIMPYVRQPEPVLREVGEEEAQMVCQNYKARNANLNCVAVITALNAAGFKIMKEVKYVD